MTMTALVTGGNRGLGRAVAERLATQGMRVAVTYRGGEPPAGFLGVRCDVRRTGEVDQAFTRIEAELGPVDVVVGNAGVTRDGLLATMREDDFLEVLDVNLTGVYRVARRAIRGMIRRRYGRVVLISSVSGLIGAAGQTNYAASKAGLIGFARAMALEVASRNITVNVVAPGWVATDMIATLSPDRLAAASAEVPLGRIAAPAEVAAVVGFLAGPEAGYLTGAVLPVDGGLSLGR